MRELCLQPVRSTGDVMPTPLALLVEDNATNRKLMRDILEIEFEVLEAESAEAAADILKTETPALILMDVQLPGMDGLTFIRRLKQDPATAAIPTVAISAHAMPDDVEEALASGCVEYVTKPLVEDLIQFVTRMKGLALAHGTGSGRPAPGGAG